MGCILTITMEGKLITTVAKAVTDFISTSQ
jgi:hypothetical protein